jgi:predicted O-methyltransferase YrrM
VWFYDGVMDDPRAFLDHVSAGYQDAMILLAANHVGVFTALRAGPRTVAELATELGCDPRALDLLLCALVASGILDQLTSNRFGLRAALAPYLIPGTDESLDSILNHHQHLLARWVHLAQVVRTGGPAPESFARRDDGSLRAFIWGMRDLSRRESREVAEALPELGAVRRLLDLGGGPGTSAITFCQRWSQLHAVVFDLPNVVPMAQEEIARAGLTDRIATRAGDYEVDSLVDAREPRFDAVYISNIIHSLDPSGTRGLLSKAVAILAPGGLLVLKDFFLDDSRTAPAFAARFAINMLVGTDRGKSYTWTETEALCRELGLVDFVRHTVGANSGLLAARHPG